MPVPTPALPAPTPAPKLVPTPAGSSWTVSDAGASCDAACGAIGGTCTDSDINTLTDYGFVAAKFQELGFPCQAEGAGADFDSPCRRVQGGVAWCWAAPNDGRARCAAVQRNPNVRN